MTFNNSILLMIKQSGSRISKNSENTSVHYTELLTKVTPLYMNSNSAKAALSRTLKDLESIGLIKRNKQLIFITNKGLASINIELKDKLVSRLNELLKKQSPELDEVAKSLITLTQRASIDSELLKTARGSASFTISDVEELRKNISEKKLFLERMDSLLSTQAQKLRELNFNDSVDFELSKKFATKISTFLGNEKAIAESSDENFLSDLRAKLNKQGQIVLLRSELKDFFELARKHPSAKINLFFRGIKATIHGQKAICFGSYSELENLK